MRSIALDLWLALKAGVLCAVEVWKNAREIRANPPTWKQVDLVGVTSCYRGFEEQEDGSWRWEDNGITASVREFEPGKWSGSAARPGEKPYVYVDFSSLEPIVDAIRRVVYQTDDGEPPRQKLAGGPVSCKPKPE